MRKGKRAGFRDEGSGVRDWGLQGEEIKGEEARNEGLFFYRGNHF
jgi:hypothetical protein